MDDLIKSTISFSWAMSLFGVQQLASAVAHRPATSGINRETKAFCSLTQAIEEQFGRLIMRSFKSGDSLQRGLTDFMFNVVASTPPGMSVRDMSKLTFDIMKLSAEVVRLFVPWPETRRALQEFQNKLEAFDLFAHVDLILAIPSQGEVRLTELIRKAEALEPYRAVWVTEGLGYYLTTTFCGQSEAPRSLLNGERGAEVPEKSLVALHAGMGLAIADQLMKTISPGSHESEIRRVLDQFVMVCRGNSRTGYFGAAYESLGLVTRNLYPQMIPKLDQALGKIDEDLVGYFWHGVGRGIYFAPTNFLPDGNSGRALKMTYQEPPHELGRRNALAGLAWAMTLVNIRHPEILESLIQHHGDQLGDCEAFINGVSSSVMIWRDSTVDDPSLKRFCSYQPDSSDGALVERWEQMVRRPCLRALEMVYPALKARRCLGEVFRCHDAMAG